MAFTARTRAQIRDEFLAYLRARYAAASPPRTIATPPGSEPYIEAEALSVELERAEVAAQEATRNIIPTTADGTAVARFGYVFGVDRDPGSLASYDVAITGAPPLTPVPIPAGTQMAGPDGTLVDIIDTTITPDLSGNATLHAKAVDFGVAVFAVGDVLTFTVAPSNLQPTGTVSAVDGGTDEESVASWARHVAEVMRERPASGNRAHWREWVLGYQATSIVDAFVYPLLPAGSVTPGTLGCVTVVAFGPPQGESTTNTRIVPSDDLSTRIPGAPLLRVMDYIEGDRSATGTAITDGSGTQLRPATMNNAASGDWAVYACGEQVQNVEASVSVTDANAFPFTSTPTIDATSDTTHVVVVGNYGPAGIEDLSGLDALVLVGTSNYRGGYYKVTLGGGVYNGGTGLTTFLVATLPAAPTAASTLYPAPGNWTALRRACLDYFDGLGPGDTTSAPSRWPTYDQDLRGVLYRSALAGALALSDRTLSASITTPAGDVVPAPKALVTLGTFHVTP